MDETPPDIGERLAGDLLDACPRTQDYREALDAALSVPCGTPTKKPLDGSQSRPHTQGMTTHNGPTPETVAEAVANIARALDGASFDPSPLSVEEETSSQDHSYVARRHLGDGTSIATCACGFETKPSKVAGREMSRHLREHGETY